MKSILFRKCLQLCRNPGSAVRIPAGMPMRFWILPGRDASFGILVFMIAAMQISFAAADHFSVSFGLFRCA